MTRDTVFLKNFRVAYTAVLSNNSPSQSMLSSTALAHDKASRPVHQKSFEVASSANNISEIFHKSITMLASYETALFEKASWKMVTNEAKRVVEVGRQESECKIERILAVPHETPVVAESGEIAAIVAKYIKDSTEQTWADAAKKQQKVVRKLLSLLPE